MRKSRLVASVSAMNCRNGAKSSTTRMRTDDTKARAFPQANCPLFIFGVGDKASHRFKLSFSHRKKCQFEETASVAKAVNPGVKHRICSRRSHFGSLRTAYIGVPSRSRTPHSMSLLPTAALHFFDRWLKFERAYCHSWAFHGGRQRQLHECGRERKQWRRHFPVAKRHGHRPLHCKHESVWWRNAHQEDSKTGTFPFIFYLASPTQAVFHNEFTTSKKFLAVPIQRQPGH